MSDDLPIWRAARTSQYSPSWVSLNNSSSVVLMMYDAASRQSVTELLHRDFPD
jgi:hypothetical protein